MIPNKEKENLVIAKESEPEISLNMYKLLTEENTDMTVTVKNPILKTDFLPSAAEKGTLMSSRIFWNSDRGVSSNHLHKLGMTQKRQLRVALVMALPNRGSTSLS